VVGVAILAAAAGALVVAALTRDVEPPKSDIAAAAVTASPSPSLAVSALDRKLAPREGRSKIHALLVGDSYSAGVGSSDPELRGYPALLRRDLGWNIDIKSTPGGAYGKTGLAGAQAVEEIIREADLASYDLILIQAGLNNASTSRATTLSAAHDAATRIWARAPNVPVVVVGAFWPMAETPASQAAEEAIHQVWKGWRNVLFLDPETEGWADFKTTDDRHPDDAGHRVIATQIEDALKERGLI
jgi:lysophospholipase L1-like esterase